MSNIDVGIAGEKHAVSVIYNALISSGLRKCDFVVKHHRWDNHYSFGTGVDIKLFIRGVHVMDVEVKNWRKQPRPYSTATYQREVIDRFVDTPQHVQRLLCITHLTLIPLTTWNQLNQHNINTATPQTLKQYTQQLTKQHNNNIHNNKNNSNNNNIQTPTLYVFYVNGKYYVCVGDRVYERSDVDGDVQREYQVLPHC